MKEITVYIDEDEKARWSQEYIDGLPDGAFLFIDENGERHLPYKDEDGEVDLPHLRDAIDRASEVEVDGEPLSEEKVAEIQERARHILESTEAERAAVGVQTERAVIGSTIGSLGQQIKATEDNLAVTDDAAYLVDDDGVIVEEFSFDEYEPEDAVAAVKEALDMIGEAETNDSVSETKEDEKVGRRIREEKVGVIEKVMKEGKEFITSIADLLKWAKYEDDELDWLSSEDAQKAFSQAQEHGSAGFAFKAQDGKVWWMQFTTNAFQDREREIFTTKSIGDYIERHKDEETKGEFWYRHIPGSKFGDVRWQAMIGRFLAQAGPFDDTDVGRAFKEFFLANPHGHEVIAPEGWGTSHGYLYHRHDKEDGIYNWLEIKESTVLPAHMASNPWNPMPMILQEAKQMNEQEKKDLETIGGASLVQMVEGLGNSKTKELEEMGVEHKAMNVVEEIKAVMEKVEDEGLKKKLQAVCDKLESYPYPKPGKKETEEEAPEPSETGEEQPEAGDLTREEVFEAMKSLMEMIRSEVTEAVKNATAETVAPISEAVKELQKSDAAKVNELVQSTPAASLDAMVKGMWGEESAKVDGRSALAKSGPKETPAGGGATGVPFIDAFISGADQRQGGSQ